MIIKSHKQFAGYFDHTVLKPEAQKDDVIKTCSDAMNYGFHSVFVNPCWISFAADLLKGSSVNVGVPIGFPLGASTTRVKAFEVEDAIQNGASEVDMVINIGALKDRNYEIVRKDIAEVVRSSQTFTCKVIIETQLLSDEEKVNACKIAEQAGAAFVKSNTGFFDGYAKLEDIQLMRNAVGKEMRVKASGGIRCLSGALKLIEAGADRLGCSKSVDIVNQWICDYGK